MFSNKCPLYVQFQCFLTLSILHCFTAARAITPDEPDDPSENASDAPDSPPSPPSPEGHGRQKSSAALRSLEPSAFLARISAAMSQATADVISDVWGHYDHRTCLKGTKQQEWRIQDGTELPAQRHFTAWAANCQESNPGLRGNFQPPWPISQTLRWKNSIFTCIWNRSVLQNGELSFPNGRNSISRYFYSQNPKCRFIPFQYTIVYLCVMFGD